MKLYYDSDGAPTWVEVVDMITFPVPRIRMDEPNTVIVEIRDWQGTLYSTWSSRDFVEMKITDGAGAPTTLFRGFIGGKKFLHNKTTLTIFGFSKKLESKPLNKQYILALGNISDVPVNVVGALSNVLAEGDVSTEWYSTLGNHWDTLDQDPEYIQLNTDISGGVFKVDEFDMDTIAGITSITEVRIYLRGSRYGQPSGPIAPSVDVYLNGGWVGYQTVSVPFGSTGWAYTTFAGAWNQGDLDALKVRIRGKCSGEYQVLTIYQMYAKILWDGIDVERIGVETLPSEDEEAKPFEWDDDEWITNQDVGILVTDNSNNNDIESWECTSPVAADMTNNGTYIAGDKDSFDAKDGVSYHAREADLGIQMDITPVIGGANIDTGLFIQKITIKWKYGIKADAVGPVNVNLFLKKDSDWTLIAYGPHSAPAARWYWVEDELVIEGTNAELLKYLTVDTGNYDELKGIKFQTEYSTIAHEVKVDYLVADIEYIAHDIAPIMEQITDNGDSWLKATGVDWTEMGVRVGDSFKIGENTTQILTDISSAANITINIQSTLSKYIAQWVRGTYSIEVLKKVCLLEGLHWWEDHQNYEIVVSKEADFVDSTVDLTQADYKWEWEFSDDPNQYKSVIVFGSAALGIMYEAIDGDINNISPLVKTIVEETIVTIPEAKEIAVTQLAELKVKRPSIRIPLVGVQADLDVGKTVTLTMVRPTVGEDDYPIRMIERHELGKLGGIKTIIWCGLGHSTWDEELIDTVNKAMYLAHKAHTDRLVSTPAGIGAVITWSQIGGRTSGVRTIINNELADGQSIDIRIDTLILTHKNIASAHHAKYTDAEALAYVNAQGLALANTKV
ncbi:hypothetical protein LCGC14_0952150, partial [marine sediment metagenome]